MSPAGSSTGPAVGLRERNRTAAMAAVQTVAVRMMRRVGFGNVTVEQIAESAGVSPSTMYRYFGTKEALVLWGDRPAQLIATLAEATPSKNIAVRDEFMSAAISTYTAQVPELLAQLRLVFANQDLAIAFEHQLLGRRHDIAAVFADLRKAKSVGARDVAAAGACLGALVALLDRWQAGNGARSLTKQLARLGSGTSA